MTTRLLLVLRHAEAGPHLYSGAGDIERPLTETGRQQAEKIGQKLAQLALPEPLQVLCSPARRTQETAAGALSALPETVIPELENGLYGADLNTLYGFIHGTPEHVQTLLLIGHNPAIGGLAYNLSGTAVQNDAFAALRHGYQPATLTVFQTQEDWINIRPSTVQALRVLTP
ncbi:phosphohistidine phosphatase [Gluconobacter japonicus]|uniref:Phosphohistidine phosphatase n=1 Tax=Gluconobacter japonicus TaxID=376620 RepID=A0A9Q2IS06_GLUJA|nr:histidine phosphatase family protein [Gluconobacter japonicus]KXV39943.1 phosphohistidine phosphatase [Gluconobacter japonicus]MBF0871380.1 phosphohistidine phosphatase [Gluconobacter japonicus]